MEGQQPPNQEENSHSKQDPDSQEDYNEPMDEYEEDYDGEEGDDVDMEGEEEVKVNLQVPSSGGVPTSSKISIPFFGMGQGNLAMQAQAPPQQQWEQPAEKISTPQPQSIKISIGNPTIPIQPQTLLIPQSQQPSEIIRIGGTQHAPQPQSNKIVLGGIKLQTQQHVALPSQQIIIPQVTSNIEAGVTTVPQQPMYYPPQPLVQTPDFLSAPTAVSYDQAHFQQAIPTYYQQSQLPQPSTLPYLQPDNQVNESQLNQYQPPSIQATTDTSMNAIFPTPQVVTYLQQPPSMISQPEVPVRQIEELKEEKVQRKKPKEKKKKAKKVKGQGDLLQFYHLNKVKVTLEFDPADNKARGQTVFKFALKPEEEVQQMLDELKSQDLYKKFQLDLKLEAKQYLVSKICIKSKGEEINEELAFDYPTMQEQAQTQQKLFENVSRDLHSFETKENQEYYKSFTHPLLVARQVAVLNFKKESLIAQLKPELDVLVSYYLNPMSNFGIKAVQYRVQDLALPSSSSQERTYYHTSDCFGSQMLWMPIVAETSYYLMNWTFKYIVPTSYTVVASGHLHIKQIEDLENPRTLYHYKLKDDERAPAFKLGFLIGQFSQIHQLSDLNQIENAHAFFLNQEKFEVFTQNNKFYERNIFNILSNLTHKLINAPYPFRSLKLVFVPNLFLKAQRKQSLDFTGGLHILDEELLFQKTQQEMRHRTYKSLTSALAFDFFGGRVYEENPEDHWLLVGIRESIGNHIKIIKFGMYLYRYHIMQTIDSVYKKAKHGFERFPLNSPDIPNPSEHMYSDLLFEKCELIMHMIESMIDKSYFERIIRELYQQGAPFVSTKLFLRIFKQVCGFKLKQFAYNWIYKTSCPKLTVSYQFNKKNNSLDLTLCQESAVKDYLVFQKYTKERIDFNDLLTKPFLRRDALNTSNEREVLKNTALGALEAMDKFIVDLKTQAQRWFQGEVNVMLYLTDGAEISPQQQKMSLKTGESQVSINIPLNVKVKKTIQNKKKEYESMHMHDNNDGDDDDDASMEKAGGKLVPNSGGHLVDNNHWKFGMNKYELEGYPLQTEGIFDVKNLESSVLWIRVDPDMEYIRKVKVVQDTNNWLFQLLLEKDIIGQIESIRQLCKPKTSARPQLGVNTLESSQLQQQFIYEILQAVCTNETYFFKVRKFALRCLQKMQTSQINRYLSHEKFLIKIFNQRNFDASIGFYKANDFSKPLEYYFDKYLLKTLAKCKDTYLAIKPEVLDHVASLNKSNQLQPAAIVEADQGSISIPLTGSILATKVETGPKEEMLKISSDDIAILFLRLLQENDNSENSMDDSHYLSQILKSLGKLDNFKHLPAIAREVHRQFKLDHIGRKFSPQFSITKGAISAYFGMRKQIYLFETHKKKYVDLTQMDEELEFFDEQIKIAEQEIMTAMDRELESIMMNSSWPLEIRAHIASYRVKHCFLYQENSFLKALYLQLKIVDNLQSKRKIKEAVDYTREIALFIERKIEYLDYREALIAGDKAKAIVNVLWSLLCLPFNYLDNGLTYWVKKIYFALYGTSVPKFMMKWQMENGIQQEMVEYDEDWSIVNGAENVVGGNLREMQAKSRMQKSQQMQRSHNGLRLDLLNPDGMKIDSVDTKLKIVLPVLQKSDQTYLRQPLIYQNSGMSHTGGSSIKISIGNAGQPRQGQSIILQKQPSNAIQIPNLATSKSFSSSTGFPMGNAINQESDKMHQTKLMQSMSLKSKNGQQDEIMDDESDYSSVTGQNQMISNVLSGNSRMLEEDNESVYDEFAEFQFETDWVQKIWDITGHLWYHEESLAFLEPVKRDDLGDFFDYYLSIIDYPMDLTSIKDKVKHGSYQSVGEWRADIDTMFKNCKSFNEEGSDIYHSAVKLQRFLFQEIRDNGLGDPKATIRIR